MRLCTREPVGPRAQRHPQLLGGHTRDVSAQAVPDEVQAVHGGQGLAHEQAQQQANAFAGEDGVEAGGAVQWRGAQVAPVHGHDVVGSLAQVRYSIDSLTPAVIDGLTDVNTV